MTLVIFMVYISADHILFYIRIFPEIDQQPLFRNVFFIFSLLQNYYFLLQYPNMLLKTPLIAETAKFQNRELDEN